jgi:hypothetical protein
MTLVCFHCGLDIPTGEGRMVGVDVPYVNIFFHKHGCWDEANSPELNQYLALNVEKLYNYAEQSNKKGRK